MAKKAAHTSATLKKPSWQKHLWLMVGLFLITLFTYSAAMENGFVWDDEVYITDEKMADAQGLWKLWTDPKSTDHPYYPLTHTSLWLEYQLWGESPAGYHFTNVLLQVLNAALVYFILLALEVPGAWIAAVIFAIHPVNVESVAWISERKNLLAGFFYFAALLSFVRYSFPKEEDDTPVGMYYAAIGFFVLSLLSKTAFCTLPLVLLMLIWWKRGKIEKGDALAVVPFFLVALILGGVTYWLETYHVGARGVDFNLEPVERVLIAGRALWFYAGKVLWPLHIMFVYPRWDVNADVWWQYLFPLGVLLGVSFLWLEQKRMGRGVLACIFFFIINLLPALGFISFYMMLFSFVADHLQYISCLGIIVLFIGTMHGIWQKKLNASPAAVYIFCAVVFLLLGMKSWQLVRDYKDEVTFYTKIIERNPLCWLAYNNRGRLLEEKGAYDLALADYQRALNVDPNCQEGRWNMSCARALNNRGIGYQYKQEWDLALKDFDKVLEINPAFMNAYLNRGAVYFQQGEFDKALENFTSAIKYDPKYTKAYQNRGLVYLQKGLIDQALLDFTKAVEIDPEYIKGHINRAIVLMGEGRFDEALDDYNQVIALDPEYVNAYYNRAVLYMKVGQVEDAMRDFRKVRALGGRVDDRVIEALRQKAQAAQQAPAEDMVFPIQ